MATPTQLIQIPLVGGLNNSDDPRALQPPALATCRDVEFDDAGGLQTRHPYDTLSSSHFFGGGAASLTISTPRKIVANGDELLLFDQNALYSYNQAIGAWVRKATHLAIAIDETPRFTTTGDQITCDRAELGGTIVYTWADGTSVFVAAIDKATNSVLLAPYQLSGAARPRVVALDTRILFFVIKPSSPTVFPLLVCYALNPADPLAALQSSSTIVYNTNAAADAPDQFYDVVKQNGSDAAHVAITTTTTTSYVTALVTATPAVTTRTVARTCDGPIAVVSSIYSANGAVGARYYVLRTTGTSHNVVADYLLSSTLADQAINVAIGSSTPTIHQLTGAARHDNSSSDEVCCVFWSAGDTIDYADWQLSEASVTNIRFTAVVSSVVRIAARLSLASRAFTRSITTHAGTDYAVYVWGVFAGSTPAISVYGTFENSGPQLQNTYYLYREYNRFGDGLLCGKSAWNRAGGFTVNAFLAYNSLRGILPGVAPVGTDSFAWCGAERRAVVLGDGRERGYTDRGPLDVVVSFDDNRARRVARLGETLYVTGAEVLQYDGQQLAEVGFHCPPWFLNQTALPAGSLANGTYTYKCTWRWSNAKGERERSTTARYVQQVISGGPKGVTLTTPTTDYSHKILTTSPIAVEIWRTPKDPANTDVPFYLVSSRNPTQSSGNNKYIANDPSIAYATGFTDALADASLLIDEQNDEVGAILENVAPPPAQIVCATQDRVFLSGIAGDPDRVWYSKLRTPGSVVAFHESLTIDVPALGGKITGLAILSETLVVFRERAIYVIPGDGLANDGGGQNYGGARVVSVDCGAESAEAITRIDMGLVFKGAKGVYLLTTGWQLQPIGLPVEDFSTELVVATHAIEAKHQVRLLTAKRALVWDYLVNQWSEWTITAARCAAQWRGVHAYLTDAVHVERADYHAGVDFGMAIETPWIKLDDLQGHGRVRRVLLLGAWRSRHGLRVRIARDYQAQDRALDTTSISPLMTSVASVVWRARLVAYRDDVLLNVYCQGAAITTEVRDHQIYSGGVWIAQRNTIGVRYGNATTVAEIEAAITAATTLCYVETSDPTPTTKCDNAALSGVTCIGTFANGADWYQSVNWVPANTIAGSIEQMSLGPRIQRCQAIKLSIDTYGLVDGITPPVGEALQLTGLGLEVGINPGLNRRLTIGQKAGGGSVPPAYGGG